MSDVYQCKMLWTANLCWRCWQLCDTNSLLRDSDSKSPRFTVVGMENHHLHSCGITCAQGSRPLPEYQCSSQEQQTITGRFWGLRVCSKWNSYVLLRKSRCFSLFKSFKFVFVLFCFLFFVLSFLDDPSATLWIKVCTFNGEAEISRGFWGHGSALVNDTTCLTDNYPRPDQQDWYQENKTKWDNRKLERLKIHLSVTRVTQKQLHKHQKALQQKT